MPSGPLDQADIDAFVVDGVLARRGAVDPDVVAACRADVDRALSARGVDPDDPDTWTEPVVRLSCPTTPAFRDAGTGAELVAAYAQLLVGTDWIAPVGTGGTIPVRFPQDADPGDAGWHLDASFSGPDGMPSLNRRSRGRGLLCLFLLDDVTDDDAPTELLVGSHHDLPAVLDRFGDDGADFITVAQAIDPETFERRSRLATGTAGDVFICHPFLVHRATWPHRGTRPRAIAQPGVLLHTHLDPEGTSPVEQVFTPR